MRRGLGYEFAFGNGLRAVVAIGAHRAHAGQPMLSGIKYDR